MNIVIDSLYKTFGAITALENINLQFQGGEFVTVLGSSGCGKTTLLHLLAGLESPSRGNIYIDGEVKDRPGADRVVVFQQAGLFPWLSVEENIEFGLSLKTTTKAQRRQASAEILRIIGLESFAKHKPYQLSGGMQQRVAIARALVMKPKVLLMDEPFGALDAQTRSSMQTFLTSLWDQLHCTIVFITHDIDEAIVLGTRLVVLSARPGKVALDVPIELERPRTPEVAFDPHFLDLKKQAMGILAH
ncbi:ABC transporter ATP-binding protein [Paraburkholderia tagetis]|uniref:ABC transporter ATP-binding protein n=1 Tax=Paraburkholderia tagetis TaxID=2913261 RepID=A0A9X1RQN6_9BURK|nr:ABC transporter ATP-binding protein [Paraburkholderia tagetis]MCG5075480.1 ABC transporter ATP-binding protein [Paraburkholderia tagetis]